MLLDPAYITFPEINEKQMEKYTQNVEWKQTSCSVHGFRKSKHHSTLDAIFY